MRSWKRVPWIAACSLVIPLVFVVLYPAPFASVVCALWSVAAMSISVYALKRQAEAERKTIIQSMEKTAIASLNHHRHDWMNDLQVLYGYLRLGKLDKSLQCVERIKERVTEESRISKLGIPSLVFYLQSFRASGRRWNCMWKWRKNCGSVLWSLPRMASRLRGRLRMQSGPINMAAAGRLGERFAN